MLPPPLVLAAADVSSGEVDEGWGIAACDSVMAGIEDEGMNAVGDAKDVVVFARPYAEDVGITMEDVFEIVGVVPLCA